MIKKIPFIVIAACSMILTTSCIEDFEATFEDFESAIVVEATITDKLEQQRVFLTRTFEFEEDGPSAESNAMVRVEGGGNVFTFQESTPGLYISSQVFAAQPNTDYQLRIETQDGRLYSSNQMTLTQPTQIDDLRAERITNDEGEDGVAILVDSFDPTGNSINYRYQYEETFKIIAPFWTPDDLEKVRPEEATQLCEVKVVVDEKSEETCFTTDFSNSIIQTSTKSLGEDRVSNFMVRFINSNNYIISHRYSILVRQFIQSNEAFTFYETLNEFSGNESFFSETQPGFLEGNISSDTNSNETVLGYFDVASVVERRIFFNYEDLFPGEELPPYVNPCVPNAPELLRGAPPVCVLSTIVENDLVRLVGTNDTPAEMEGPYLVVPRVCGDCSEIGKAEVPEFWIEE
ncbi:DUF4249 domain-containing protein [Flagellimonas aquimarina]|uniref:DUF4249 domain-containing protein n=1 Tax=Flagellimonas aquimarina TaxID=2201895 RepID=A0A316KYQ0_9FLAO|nr:DUF4249 domain-containing protein [Allomuricauda koreensis]PWL38746.1 DUF4249 domain-containing protein [Allomuricauda koreensis]